MATRLADKEAEFSALGASNTRLVQDHRVEMEAVAERLRLAEVDMESGREAVTALREDKVRLEAQLSSLAEQTTDTSELMEQMQLANQQQTQQISALKVVP